MKRALGITVLTFLISCSRPNPEEFKKFMNGYWEIEYVILKDGTKKTYTFNQSIDFFEAKDTLGIRKKMQPRLNGTFITTNDRELFKLKIENDSLRMYYKTPLSQWKETLILAKEDRLIIKNEAGNTYFYKPYEKIQL